MNLFFDGGARPNPGMMEVAVVVMEDGKPPVTHHQKLGQGTNNIAEWVGLLWAMQIADEAGATDPVIRGDSQLVVNQANGLWRVNSADLAPFHSEFQQRKKAFRSLCVEWVRRNKNPAGHHLDG